jgi:hypothetical protein
MDWSHLAQNCLLYHIIKGQIEGRINVTGIRGRSKQLLDDLKEKKGYCNLKQAALDWNLRRTYNRMNGT